MKIPRIRFSLGAMLLSVIALCVGLALNMVPNNKYESEKFGWAVYGFPHDAVIIFSPEADLGPTDEVRRIGDGVAIHVYWFLADAAVLVVLFMGTLLLVDHFIPVFRRWRESRTHTGNG